MRSASWRRRACSSRSCAWATTLPEKTIEFSSRRVWHRWASPSPPSTAKAPAVPMLRGRAGIGDRLGERGTATGGGGGAVPVVWVEAQANAVVRSSSATQRKQRMKQLYLRYGPSWLSPLHEMKKPVDQ